MKDWEQPVRRATIAVGIAGKQVTADAGIYLLTNFVTPLSCASAE